MRVRYLKYNDYTTLSIVHAFLSSLSLLLPINIPIIFQSKPNSRENFAKFMKLVF